MARAATAASASNASPARLRTGYDTGAATADDGSVDTGVRVGPGFVDAAGAPIYGAIPTDGAGVAGGTAGVAGGTAVVGDARTEAADAGGALVAVAEPIDVWGLVTGDVATEVATKPDPLTATFLPGRPFGGSSVITGPAARIRDSADGVLGVVVCLVSSVSRIKAAVAQTAAAPTRQALT